MQIGQETAQPVLDELYREPETRLLLAVLQDALATFQRGLNNAGRKDLQRFREVDYWFRSRSYDSPFSFESICNTFRLDSGSVRDVLNSLKRSALMEGQATAKEVVPRGSLRTRRSWVHRVG
ncbi:MAG TPA: hypothetical protein VN634_03995 [Candidatus Limnocylindrales bacterium]|nr:hypothetical protein [Candidatus Limnocylindrales bacterium]